MKLNDILKFQDNFISEYSKYLNHDFDLKTYNWYLSYILIKKKVLNPYKRNKVNIGDNNLNSIYKIIQNLLTK